MDVVREVLQPLWHQHLGDELFHTAGGSPRELVLVVVVGQGAGM